jgi:hypothetical protein
MKLRKVSSKSSIQKIVVISLLLKLDNRRKDIIGVIDGHDEMITESQNLPGFCALSLRTNLTMFVIME